MNKLKDEGHMIIIISHDENLAYEYADRVIIMSNGEIIFNGGRADAFKDNDLLKKAKIPHTVLNANITNKKQK